MLERPYRMTPDAKNATTAAKHVAILKLLPPEVVQATSLFSDGELTPAENIVRAYLLQHSNHTEAMRLLAKIGSARGVLDDAQLLLEAVLALAPDYRAARHDYRAARHDYALVLIERHKYQTARAELEKLLPLEPENRHYRTLHATACVGLGEHEKAIVLYRELLIGARRSPDLYLSIAHSLKTIGRRQEAIDAYRTAAAIRPNFGNAYEDRGEYPESWRYYERGNALKRSERRYRPEIIEGNTRKQIEICTREFFAARVGVGAQEPDPIFILGLPRAGSRQRP